MSPNAADRTSRRDLIVTLAGAGGALLILGFAFGWQHIRRLLRLDEEPLPEHSFRAGTLADFETIGVYTGHQEQYGVWIVHQPDDTLIALQTVCTHLGCTPDWKPEQERAICPCHGSRYDMSGINVAGPTERPLERCGILRRGNEVYVNKGRTFRQELGEWSSPDSFIDLRPL